MKMGLASGIRTRVYCKDGECVANDCIGIQLILVTRKPIFVIGEDDEEPDVLLDGVRESLSTLKERKTSQGLLEEFCLGGMRGRSPKMITLFYKNIEITN